MDTLSLLATEPVRAYGLTGLKPARSAYCRVRNSYIGTLVCFFMIVNLIQVPAHIFIWKTITLDTLLLDITLAPLILAGAILGILVVKRIPEKPYRFLIIIMTSLSALKLLF